MNYELAKQLKDAGYKFQPMSMADDKVAELRKRQIDFGEYKERIRFVLTPTLEELIDACGDEFRLLELVSGKRWECVGVDEFFDTPTEAVAKLYIQLNEKR